MQEKPKGKASPNESGPQVWPEQSKRFCFVLSPIGDRDSMQRRRADGVLNEIIRPALEAEYRVERADHDKTPGLVTEAIISKITAADLVVADLTGTNPNVMYELAVRHAVGTPVVQILEEGQKLPFDIQNQNTIFFISDLAGRRDAIKNIREAVHAVRDNPDLGNPIKRAAQFSALKASGSDETRVLVEALGNIQRDLTFVRTQAESLVGREVSPSDRSLTALLALAGRPSNAATIFRRPRSG